MKTQKLIRAFFACALVIMIVASINPIGTPAEASQTPTSAPTTAQSGCSLDLMLVLDGSGSISPPDFAVMREFVRDMTSSFNIGPA